MVVLFIIDGTFGDADEVLNQLWCWGYDNSTDWIEGYQPLARLIEHGTDWSMIASSRALHCAIDVDAALWCWGNNRSQIFGANAGDQKSPTPIAEDQQWSYVSTSSGFLSGSLPTILCAIDTDDHLWCWGQNSRGQLGDGTTTASSEPRQMGTDLWSDIDTAPVHTCGVQQNGTLWCWGQNNQGQLGVPGIDQSEVPVQVGDQNHWTSVSVGDPYTCAVTDSGELYCWGSNSDNQLGIYTINSASEPERVGSDDDWSMVATTNRNTGRTCGLKEDGTLFCWGENLQGSLGTGSAFSNQSTPVEMAPGRKFQSVDLGRDHSCAIDLDDEIYCWGTDQIGQLGLQRGFQFGPRSILF